MDQILWGTETRHAFFYEHKSFKVPMSIFLFFFKTFTVRKIFCEKINFRLFRLTNLICNKVTPTPWNSLDYSSLNGKMLRFFLLKAND